MQVSKPELPGPEEVRMLDLTAAIITREGMRSEREFLLQNGLNPTLLYKVRTGKQQLPPLLVSILANKYLANVTYIYTGQGEPFGDAPSKPESNASFNEEAVQWVELPLITERVTASFVENFGQDYRANLFEDTLRIPLQQAEKLPKGAAVVVVSGDSMEPQLQDGAKILISPISPADFKYINSGVYVVAYGSFFVVKRIKDNELLRFNYLTLHSDNPKAGNLIVEWKDLRGIWKVLEIARSPVY